MPGIRRRFHLSASRRNEAGVHAARRKSRLKSHISCSQPSLLSKARAGVATAARPTLGAPPTTNS